MKPFLSICMIVKDEEKVLKRCLESICGIADEIIIADTGSIDKSKEIAAKYTDMVFDYKWEGDFSKARNFAASKASGDWILVIDADEFVDRENFMAFKDDLKLNPPDFNILAVQIVNFVGQNGKDTALNFHERLYINDGKISYYRNIHELLKHRDSKESKGYSKFQIYHSGYMKNVVNEKEKSKRNLKLLINNKVKEPIDYYFMGNEYDQLDELDKAIKCYQKAYKLKDDINRDWVKKLLLRFVNTLHRAKRDNEALEIIDSCENIYPGLVDFKFYRGKIYFDNEQFRKSGEVFEKILAEKHHLIADSSPDFLEFLPNKYLGEIYENENRLHLAVKSYSKALSINDTDDYIWIRLIGLLSKHSTLEELSEFLNNNLLNKSNITVKRVISILLSVPNLDVQKLTRSLLEDENLTELENEGLFLRNLLLDGDTDEILTIINQKSESEIFTLLSTGIFNIIDFIILILKTNNEGYKKIIHSIKFNKPINNLLLLLLEEKKSNLSVFEQELFLLIYKQSYILGASLVIEQLETKVPYLSRENRNKLNKIRSGKII
ncbi:glycosyltransferase [Bacillus sinesaloumensis]|uniref:tetratricopeptide repeat-containing glycosyltransferase family 2 protein n=1 Tax=Litchfieldia sinesaloumensis TaxID=1926280 RepID=UPI000988763E|nr:glycosyltransferase [Bacillus sinesaloumensis]